MRREEHRGRVGVRFSLLALLAWAGFVLAAAVSETHAQETRPVVLIRTSLGTITVELYPDKAPITVDNFLKYVDDGFYDGTVFHRVIKDFIIQGGGYDTTFSQKETFPPIENEAATGLSNKRGTIAIARMASVNSATCQFFINLRNNVQLDHRDNTDRGFGYCAFGRVISGMETVDKIAAVETTAEREFSGHCPLETVEIVSIRRIRGAGPVRRRTAAVQALIGWTDLISQAVDPDVKRALQYFESGRGRDAIRHLDRVVRDLSEEARRAEADAREAQQDLEAAEEDLQEAQEDLNKAR